MGKVDTVTKAYMRKNNIFADAFNYLIYDGKPVVNPEQLRELDTTEIALPFGLRENEKGPSNDLVQKYRDILKSAVVMQHISCLESRIRQTSIMRCLSGT